MAACLSLRRPAPPKPKVKKKGAAAVKDQRGAVKDQKGAADDTSYISDMSDTESESELCPLTEEKPCVCSIQYGGSGSFVKAKLMLDDEGMLSVREVPGGKKLGKRSKSVDAEDRAKGKKGKSVPSSKTVDFEDRAKQQASPSLPDLRSRDNATNY